MDTQRAIFILIRAAELGQSKGVYTFAESALILEAIQTLSPPPSEENSENSETDGGDSNEPKGDVSNEPKGGF